MSPVGPDDHAEGLIEDLLQRGDPGAPPEGQASEVLTFLVADIRGYTTFTQQRGDEAAEKLTAKFAMIVRELVGQFGGTVFELRGDEALCVFSSPRQSLRLAVAVQQRFVQETLADANLPMTVGIGIDAGEAVRGSDGYRGGALNLAARLCSQAKAGQVLASPEVAHVARTIDGIRYATLDRVALKGLAEPIRPVRVFPDGEDPARQMAALLATATTTPTPGPRWLPKPLARHPRLSALTAALVAVLVAGILVVTLRADNTTTTGLKALSENSLGLIDPDNGRIIDQVNIADGPTAVAAAFGSIWTTNTDANTVTRIDAASLHVIDKITVGAAPSAIAAGPDSMWVTNSNDGTVSRIDPTTGETRLIQVGVAPSGVVLAHGSVWVTNAADGTVSRIDPAKNAVVQRIPVGSGPTGIAAGRDIWVANSASDTVTQIDGLRDVAIGDIPVGTTPRNVAVLGDGVWVTYNGSNAVVRISTSDASLGNPVPVGQHPDQLTAVDGHVWTTLQGSGAIVEIDPATGGAVHTVPVGPVPGGITAADGKLWVTTTSDPTKHRGGTLRLDGELSGIDPDYEQGPLLGSSYDGLVTYQHASGADGLTAVPDLASAIPEPTDGGLTYTFRLRDGIRYSSGRSVTVDDVKRGIERATANSAFFTLSLVQVVVGATRCSATSCHISGITVDDATRTVTFKLLRPTGNLFALLSGIPPMPAGTPLAEQTRPIPGTGPYQVESYVLNKLAVLTRNPFFHEWSAAAQPAGFPDRIEYRIHPDDTTKPAIDDVAAGRADWTDALIGDTDLDPAYPVDALQTRFGDRLRITPGQDMYGVFLNTRIPPFDNVKVRQALAYAIDRKAVAHDWFAPATPTCQFTPPDYPGYQPYCPYTSRTRASTWQGADLAKGQELVAGLHPERTTVTVWADRATKLAFQHIVDALRALAFHVRFRVWPDTGPAYFGYVLDSRHRVQAGFMGWLTYDSSAANLFAVYRCGAFRPANGNNNYNPAEFCDHNVDGLMNQAEVLQATSLAAANELWAKVDRRLVTAAPWVPLVNTSSVDVLSARVHNFKRSPALGVLFDQMWVQ